MISISHSPFSVFLFRANAVKRPLHCQVRSIEGSDLDALDFHPEFKIEPRKGFEDQFEQVVLSLRVSATGVVVTADGYGLNGHEHLDFREGIHIQGSFL